MLETLLHTGADHPDLAWILLPSLLSFLAGLGLGLRTRTNRLRERLRTASAEGSD